MSPELQCDHDQLVCPLQNITCQCVATGTKELLPAIYWYLQYELVGQINNVGKAIYYTATVNYTATVEVLENALSSNLSFRGEPQYGPLTVLCADNSYTQRTRSFLIEGLFLEVQSFSCNQSFTYIYA